VVSGGARRRSGLANPLTYLPSIKLAVQLEALAVVRGVDDIVEVVHSPYVPADTVVVIDKAAIEAGMRESLAQVRQSFREFYG